MPPVLRHLFGLLALLGTLHPSTARAAEPPELWPAAQREFYLDGAAWLLPEERRTALAGMAEAERAAAIEGFLSAAETPGISAAELAEAIRRRQALMRGEMLSPTDVRARLLFLRGAPAERVVIDCAQAFHPLEVWTYRRPPPEEAPDLDLRDELVVYRPGAGRPWKLWTPYDSKRALYTSQMEYFLEQWEELNLQTWRAVRFDLQACPLTLRVDRATGVRALTLYRRARPRPAAILAHLEAPRDLARWVKEVLAAPPPEGSKPLEADLVTVDFPEVQGQRMVARFQVRVPEAWELPTAAAERVGAQDSPEEIRLVVEGLVEQDGEVLDEFRFRFLLPPPEEGRPAVLVFGEPLRTGQAYVVRLRVRDELSGRSSHLSGGFRVPSRPRAVELPYSREEAVVAIGRSVARERIIGEDSLLLVPPAADIVLSYWRAEAIVSGERIVKVAFSVDGETQLTVGRQPFSAELRLARFPKEQVIRAEGLDASGAPVAADEVVLNQPRGALAVRITEPPVGRAFAQAETEVVAQVVVPDGRRVEQVVFQVDGAEVARVERPPWRALIRPPAANGLSYLSVTATLDDGRSAEDVRILNAPDFVEQLDVDLVELYAAVTDRSGRPVRGLSAEDFEVYVDGKRLPIHRFETMDNLPLVLGLTVDSSGSMAASLAVAQEAARGFLREILGVRDHAFAVGFSDYPVLLIPPTSDGEAVANALGKLRAVGWTALHDAVVTSLYYFRGYPGQKALVLLSDGDDTRSSYGFDDVLEYARRSGTAVYSVGVGVGAMSSAKRKLQALAAETGGRAFLIGRAEELDGVYAEIEEELRGRYMLAVAPERVSGDGFREVEVRVRGRGMAVRTARWVIP